MAKEEGEEKKDITGRLIGKAATYHPSSYEGTRPKGKSLPALVVNSFIQEKYKDPKSGEVTREEREVVNLVVFQDADQCTVRKQRVPHKDDAAEGESYYSE